MLHLESVSVEFPTAAGTVRPVDGVSLTVKPGERHVIVGETGSGKSVLLMSILGLSGGRVTGSIRWNGQELLGLTPRAWNRIRGREIAYIPQGNASGLNPLMRIGDQIAEPLRVHLGMGRKAAAERAVAALGRLDFAKPEIWASRYPHQLSGGMKQRALVAMGTVAGGQLLLADEPTKGLDPERRDDVRELFADLSGAGGPALLCVTHDLRFARDIATHIHVLYAGQLLESGPAGAFFAGPLHPYAQMMLEALPEHGFRYPRGFAPSHEDYGQLGCRFAGRCPLARDVCRQKVSAMTAAGERRVRCHDAAADRASD